MDINILARALTLSSNDAERKQNEKYLQEAKSQPNFCPGLLNIACDFQYPPETGLMAGIQLKNLINSNWKYGQDTQLNKQLRFEQDEPIIVISKEDKEYIRNHILEALVYSTGHVKLMKQLNQCIKKICKLDFELWKENLMGIIIENFKSGDDKRIFAGIIAFFQVSKVFEFESGVHKENFNKAFTLINPYLLSFLGGLMDKLNTPEAALIVFKIFKIYFKSIQLDLCSIIYDEKLFENWNFYLVTVMKHILADNFLIKTEKPEEVEELNRSIFWKLKKISFMITYRLYQKYGYSETSESHLKNFAILIESKYVKLYFDVYTEVLFNSKVHYVSDYVLCLIYKFMSQMLSRFHLFEEIEKRLQVILNDHAIQNAMFTVKDFELWKNDPKSYINKQFDITENYYVTRYAVCQFIKTLCTFKKKTKDGRPIGKTPYYEDCFKFLINILEMYEDQISKGIDVDVRIKESVMYILQSIAPNVIKRSKDKVEKIIQTFVVKEFNSQFGFLRERACTFIESYEDYKYTDSNLLKEITQKICIILDTETELPVKVMAAITAPILLKHPGVKELLSDSVPKLLEIYLNLVNTIDLEEILDGLETIISRFNYAVKDYAVALTFELVKLFKRLSESEEDDAKGEQIMVLEGVLRTLLKIIELFVNNEEIFSKIEPSIHEIIMWGLKAENFEKFDDTIDIIQVILKKSNNISFNTWSYFPEVIFSLIGSEEEISEFKKSYPNVEFEGLGFENIQDIIPVLCLYIVKDPVTFLTGVDKFKMSYLSRVFSLVQSIISLGKSKKEYQNVKYGLKLLNIILETLKGKIDDKMKEILVFLINEISQNNVKTGYKITLLETIANCFFYNPYLAIQITESKNFIEKLFQIWIPLIPEIKMENEIKRTLMAFTAILTVQPGQQNKTIIENISTIIAQIIKLSEGIDTKKQKKLMATSVDADFEEDEDEEEDRRESELNEYLKQNRVNALNDFKSPDENDDELCEDEEEDEDWDEFSSMTNITLVDKLDEIIYIRDAFTHISQTDANYYQDLMKLIDDQSKLKLETFIKNAEARNVDVSPKK